MNTEQFTNQFERIEFPNLGYIKMPKLEITKEQKQKLGLSEHVSSEEFLIKLAKNNFEEKIKSGLIKEEYSERLKFELDTIIKLQFTDYVILIYQIINFCKENNILNSPGRGSVVGSLLFYVIGVTTVDPIKHDLLFERFISAARTDIKQINGQTYISSSSLPDVDIDSDRALKYKINEFITSKFPNKTAPISTFGTYQSKILIKECLKVIENYQDSETKKIAEMIEAHFGKVQSIDDSLEDNPEFSEWAENHLETIKVAKKLHGLIRNKSTHASGIIISDENLIENMPLELNSDKEIVCGYDMEYAQMFGIKVDNLGLKNLGAIDRCLKMINKKIEDIDINHKSIYQFLNLHKDYYYGIFQCEEGLTKKTLQKIEAIKIDDIMAAISLSRPGAFRFIDDYINHKKGIEIRKINPKIKDILEISNNIIIYQEQIMKLSQRMANFSPQESDGLRKGIGKKIKEKVLQYKEKFINNSIKNGFSKEEVDDIWQSIENSGDYLFNASHCTAYSYITAITTYLKANYTKEFFLSLLLMSKHEAEPIKEIETIFKELKHFNIKLLPPHIIKSDLDFTIENNDIRFGLSSIKGIAEKTIEKLNNFRNKYSNKFEIFCAAAESGLSIGVLSALIQAGALEGFKQSRSKVTLEAQTWNLLTPKEQKYCIELGEKFNYDLLKIIKELVENIKDAKSKPIISTKRFNTIKKYYEPYKQIYMQNSKSEDLANYFYERKLLGYSYSTTLKDLYKEKSPYLLNIQETLEKPTESFINMIGIIESCTESKTQKNKKMFRYEITDESGQIRGFLFENNISEVQQSNNEKLPAEEDIIILKGKKKDDVLFCNQIFIQTQKIYTKLSDLKENKVDKKD